MHAFDWDDLRCFLAVAHEGSTLAAARHLKLHQTTVARRIEALEKALGVALFERATSGYQLSTAGIELLPIVDGVGVAAQRVEEFARLLARRNRSIVRVTTSDVLANLVVTPALTAFAAAHPGVQIQLVIEDRMLDLSLGEADLALRVGKRPEDGALVIRSLAEAAWGIYCSTDYAARQGHPSTPHELASHAVLGFDGGLSQTPPGQWVSRFSSAGGFAAQNNNLVNHLQAIKAGIGVGALPRVEGDRHADLLLCIPRMEGASQTVWLVMRKDGRKSDALSAFADFLIERVEAMKRKFAAE